MQHLVIRDWLPEQIANGPHGHWSTHRKKLQAAKIMAWASARHARWTPVQGRAKLTIVFVFGQQRRRDTDNLYARAKGLVDGLKEWIVDDSAEWLDLSVRAEVRPGERATELTLESI